MRKHQDTMKKFMVYFIAAIMIMSVFGVVFFGYNDMSTQRVYNGYKFTSDEDGWTTKINKKTVNFYFYPESLEDIEVDPSVREMLSDKVQIGMTSDINDELNQSIALMQYIYSQMLPELSDVYTGVGFTTNNTYRATYTCEDAMPTVPVIYMKEGNETKVIVEGDCVILTAQTDRDMVALGERVLYLMLGVMKE